MKEKASIKIVLVGSFSVGKTCIFNSFVYDNPGRQNCATIGAQFVSRNINKDDDIYKLMIWDTAGQERFRSLVPIYLKGTHGIILVYDKTDYRTFTDLKYWLSCVQNTCPDTRIIIVGNKADLKSQISTKEGHDYALSQGFLFKEISALNTTQASNIFIELVDDILAHGIDDTESDSDTRVNIADDNSYNFYNNCCYK